MTKKNLVQELREIAAEKGECSAIRSILRSDCTSTSCNRCIADAIDIIADRIEAEYEPKPEPDTVEKVARDMVGDMIKWSSQVPTFIRAVDVERFMDRLEVLGVKVDG